MALSSSLEHTKNEISSSVKLPVDSLREFVEGHSAVLRKIDESSYREILHCKS